MSVVPNKANLVKNFNLQIEKTPEISASLHKLENMNYFNYWTVVGYGIFVTLKINNITRSYIIMSMLFYKLKVFIAVSKNHQTTKTK